MPSAKYVIVGVPGSIVMNDKKSTKVNEAAAVALQQTFTDEGAGLMTVLNEGGRNVASIKTFAKQFQVEVTEFEEPSDTVMEFTLDEDLELQDVVEVPTEPDNLSAPVELDESRPAGTGPVEVVDLESEPVEDIESDTASDSSEDEDVAFNRDALSFAFTDAKTLKATLRNWKTKHGSNPTVTISGVAQTLKHVDSEGFKKPLKPGLIVESGRIETVGNKWITLFIGGAKFYVKVWSPGTTVNIE